MTDVQKGSQATQGLVLTETTIFERSEAGRPGFQLPPLGVPKRIPSKFNRSAPAELPEVSELQVVRHFTRLSTWNYAIDLGSFPLGSCTMKYNPRINEELAALPGLSHIHPDLPETHCQGAMEIMYRLSEALCSISGLDACSLQPAAGAHGEFTGLSVIHAFHEHHGSSRKYVIVPDSAHGTNPATCALLGYEVITVKTGPEGIVTVPAVEAAIEKYGREIAGMMLTNPNTLGLFESNIAEIAERLHGIGAQLYMDGANMNANMGVAKARDMGVDVMHYNLHKTFSTPHGGGGPGSGPVAVRSHLADFLPKPMVTYSQDRYQFFNPPHSIGKVKGGYGNFGMFVRALAYILNHGSDGLKQVSKAAVLNANYLRYALSDAFQLAYDAPSMHEFVLSDQKQLKQGVRTLDIAKALIDRGFHPPTIYFPLIVSGAMLIEPTETESLGELDILIDALKSLAQTEKSEDSQIDGAPFKTVVGKVDEVGAARNPILTLDDRPRG